LISQSDIVSINKLILESIGQCNINWLMTLPIKTIVSVLKISTYTLSLASQLVLSDSLHTDSDKKGTTVCTEIEMLPLKMTIYENYIMYSCMTSFVIKLRWLQFHNFLLHVQRSNISVYRDGHTRSKSEEPRYGDNLTRDRFYNLDSVPSTSDRRLASSPLE